MSQIAGGCLCGAVTYRCDAEPVMGAVCHCTRGQQQSGGAFSVHVGIPKGSLRFTAGQTRVFEDQGSSGLPVYRHSCSDGGSPIFSDVVVTPQLGWLKAGTLADAGWVEPSAHIGRDSTPPWVALPHDLPRFAQSPTAAWPRVKS